MNASIPKFSMARWLSKSAKGILTPIFSTKAQIIPWGWAGRNAFFLLSNIILSLAKVIPRAVYLRLRTVLVPSP